MSELMSREQLAGLLGISRAFIADLLQYEDAPKVAKRVNKSFMYRADEALAWVASDLVGRHRALIGRKRGATFEEKARKQSSSPLDLALARRFLTGKEVRIETGCGLSFL